MFLVHAFVWSFCILLAVYLIASVFARIQHRKDVAKYERQQRAIETLEQNREMASQRDRARASH